jgi:hypothetical protein
MPPVKKLDLSPGTVLHVHGYASRGHPPRSKFLLVIGAESDTRVLGFLISSQAHWMNSAPHQKETVVIPARATDFLSRESYIQCWELERLDLERLEDGHVSGQVERCGKLPARYLYRIRDVVKSAFLLEQGDAEAVLRVLPQ